MSLAVYQRGLPHSRPVACRITIWSDGGHWSAGLAETPVDDDSLAKRAR